MARTRILLICQISFLFLLSPAHAAPEVAPGERVGLVLSGGGARGFAHIGVLQALEENNIPVHAIAGTSMGAIVGGLYASGKNAAEVEQVARTTDWAYAFTDRSPRRDQPYIFRQLDAGLAADYRLNIRDGAIVLPRGVIQGQHLTQILDQLFADIDRVTSFDRLAIPFRAVAADLVTGEQVVMSRGRLSTAVRASMSIPGLLEPVEWDGKLLVDGGIANNLPVDVARAMGVDRLIVVDVGTPARTADEIQSVVDVVDQLTGLLVRSNSDAQQATLTGRDILIRPQLVGVTNSSFGAVDEAMAAGYAAAIQTLAANDLLGDRVPVTVPPREGETGRTPVIDFIEVENDGPVHDRVIRNLLRQKAGQPLDTVRLQEDISAIYGLDYFRDIRYRVIERDGQTGLRLVCRVRHEGSNFLRVGLRVSDDFRGNSDFGLGASLRLAGLNRLGGTAFMRADIGTTPRLEARFVQPLDFRMRYFIEPQLLYQADRIDLFDEAVQEEALASYQRRERQAGLAIGRQLFRQRGEVRAGMVRKWGDLDFRGGLSLGEGDYDDAYSLARIGWDTLDDLAFPTRGTRWAAEWQWHEPSLGADNTFRRFVGEATFAMTWRRYTFLLEGDLSVSDSDQVDIANLIPIGGFLELSGLGPRSRWGQHRALTRLVALTPLGPDTPLPAPVPLFVGASLERGNVWETRDDMGAGNAISAGSVFLGADTPVGPAYLAVGVAQGGDYAVNLFLGQLFR